MSHLTAIFSQRNMSGPWPAARDAPPIIQRARAIKLGVLGEKTRRAPEGSFD